MSVHHLKEHLSDPSDINEVHSIYTVFMYLYNLNIFKIPSIKHWIRMYCIMEILDGREDC